MGVQVKRVEPVELPPAKEVVVVGNASQRGFKAVKMGSQVVLSGVKNGGSTVVPDPHGWTLRLKRDDALNLISALTELVTR